MTTTAVFFPFDLFGSAGASRGAELLADALEEMLADNRRERVPTRAQAYSKQVRVRQVEFRDPSAYQDWRKQGRKLVRQVLRKGEFLTWVTGNHLGVLPVYDELSDAEPGEWSDTLVIQFDAHLDIYNLTDCSAELSHGNYLLHCAGALPPLINVGNRELLLHPDHVRKFYRETFPASSLAGNLEPALQRVQQAANRAKRVFLDIDCDVFDPAFFPAVSHPLPCGLSPRELLRFLDAAWSERVIGVAISEFDPGRDHHDQSLSTLVWLLEYLFLKRHEPPS